MPVDHGRGGCLLVGYLKDDMQRRWYSGANIRAGKCIGCGGEVFVNDSGARMIKQRGDVDLTCYECEKRYSADMIGSL